MYCSRRGVTRLFLVVLSKYFCDKETLVGEGRVWINLPEAQ